MIAAAAIPTTSQQAQAAGAVFYERATQFWQIEGDYGDATLDPSCSLSKEYRDSSYFGLYKNLTTGELFILVRNAEWDIVAAQGDRLEVTYNFYTNTRLYDSLSGYAVLVSKNTVVIPNITGETFLDPFFYASEMRMIMPGTIPNATINLTGTAEGLGYLSECVEAAQQQRRDAPRPQIPNNLLQL